MPLERALEHLGPAAAMLSQAPSVRAFHAFGQTDLASARATHRKLEPRVVGFTRPRPHHLQVPHMLRFSSFGIHGWRRRAVRLRVLAHRSGMHASAEASAVPRSGARDLAAARPGSASPAPGRLRRRKNCASNELAQLLAGHDGVRPKPAAGVALGAGPGSPSHADRFTHAPRLVRRNVERKSRAPAIGGLVKDRHPSPEPTR